MLDPRLSFDSLETWEFWLRPARDQARLDRVRNYSTCTLRRGPDRIRLNACQALAIQSSSDRK